MEHPAGESPLEIEPFIDRLEKFAGRKLSHRDDLALLLSCSRGKEGLLEEASFYAKFISKAYAVLKRSGGEDVTRMEAEFGEKMGKTTVLLRTLLEGSPGDTAKKFANRFLSPTPESMAELLSLLAELSWVKNYEIEQRRSSS